jgi:hypothetical protein
MMLGCVAAGRGADPPVIMGLLKVSRSPGESAPLLPASLIEPLWVEFAALIGTDDRPEFAPDQPWGCHRRRVQDRVVFDHVIAALVHGSGYERVATPGCSDRTVVADASGPRTDTDRRYCGSACSPTVDG